MERDPAICYWAHPKEEDNLNKKDTLINEDEPKSKNERIWKISEWIVLFKKIVDWMCISRIIQEITLTKNNSGSKICILFK